MEFGRRTAVRDAATHCKRARSVVRIISNRMNTQFIILAAGKGTRMNSALPKVLVGLKGKPLIQHLLDSIRQISHEHKPVIVVGHKYDLVQSYLGSNFIYAFQEGQLGTAHAVASAESKVEAENALVLYGDMPFVKSDSLKKLVDLHLKNESMFSMLTTQVPNFENEFSSFLGFGRIIRQNGKISAIREFVDAAEEERQIKEVNPGIYLFNSKWLWEHLPQVPKNKHDEYYLTDLVEIAIKKNVPIATAAIDPLEVFGINTPAQLQQAENLL